MLTKNVIAEESTVWELTENFYNMEKEEARKLYSDFIIWHEKTSRNNNGRFRNYKYAYTKYWKWYWHWYDVTKLYELWNPVIST